MVLQIEMQNYKISGAIGDWNDTLVSVNVPIARRNRETCDVISFRGAI
jgi:hypothetical protein